MPSGPRTCELPGLALVGCKKNTAADAEPSMSAGASASSGSSNHATDSSGGSAAGTNRTAGDTRAGGAATNRTDGDTKAGGAGTNRNEGNDVRASTPATSGWAASLALVRGKASATSVAIDSKNNAIVAIRFEHSITIGTETIDGGEGGALLVKVPIEGGPIAWTKLLGKDRTVEYASVAVDSKDAVVLTATMRGTVDLGGGALTSAGDKDILLAKLGSDGAHAWSKRFGGREPDRPTNVAVDAKDTIAVAGYYADAVDFGGKKLTGKNSAEMFVARYTAQGKLVFANRISGGGETQSELYDVAVDAKSNAIAIGAFSGKLDLGGKPLAGIAGKAIQTFVVVYTPTGSIAWSTAYAPGGMTMANHLRVDKAGNLLLAGTDMTVPVDQNNMVAFDVASGAPTQGTMTSFIAQLGPDRKPRWTIAIASLGMGDTVEHEIGDSGEILVVGDAASAPFGDPALRDVKTFFARISPAGVLVSVAPIPNASQITASPKLATRGTTAVIVVQTGEGTSQGLTLLRPE